MPTVNDTYINALLADAAYEKKLVDGLQGADLITALSPRLTPTFNSAGFIITSEPVFQNIALILDTGATQFHNNAQTNFYAEHGIDVTTNNWYFSQIGQRVPLFNEEGTGIPNHLMYKLTDALALADVMSTLDGNLSLPVITALLDAGSAQPASSLENILDELRKILLNQTNKTQIGDTGDSADSRKDYHIKLDGLRTFANVTISTPSTILVMSLSKMSRRVLILSSLPLVIPLAPTLKTCSLSATRRVIEYVLSPFMQHQRESLNER